MGKQKEKILRNSCRCLEYERRLLEIYGNWI